MLISTRGTQGVTASQAILRGIAPDGGLYAPTAFTRFTLPEIEALCPLSYAQRAARVLSALLDDFTPEEVASVTEAAYGASFSADSAPAPVRTLNGNTHLLELFHGPTLAFKDIALQILPHLLPLSARKNGVDAEIVILVATSGDTGKAALEGFCDVPGTRCAVFYPKDGVSRAQYLQMATQAGHNTHVVAVEGNFDDAQTGVKRIFANEDFARTLKARGQVLTSANSINYGRLAPQVVYYFSAYADLLQRGKLRPGEPVHFVVPTGNFGNILAALYAREMGLPVGKLFCASNANRVLADFIRTGRYDVNRAFYKTDSPSMDILISSNLERYLFELSGRDPAQVRAWMASLAREGRYAVPSALLARLNETIVGGWVCDDEGQSAIRHALHEANVLIDPHTAVAWSLLTRHRKATGDKTPAVIVSTASPYKFGHAVARAFQLPEQDDDFACCRTIARLTGQAVPERITALETLPIRHSAACAPDAMEKTLLELFQSAR
ncbi:threonine synthase [Clostridia bacterium]|nr:threonine synthase [Clostridia bacterium]